MTVQWYIWQNAHLTSNNSKDREEETEQEGIKYKIKVTENRDPHFDLKYMQYVFLKIKIKNNIFFADFVLFKIKMKHFFFLTINSDSERQTYANKLSTHSVLTVLILQADRADP